MSEPSRRRRVAIVSRIYTPEPAAASFALENVAVAFRDAGWEVEVITTTYRDAPRRSQDDGILVRRAPVRRSAAGYVRGYLSYLSYDLPLVFRLLALPRTDLLYVEPPPTTGAVVRVVAGLRRIPYAYDAADIWSDAAATMTGSRLVPRILRAIERFAIRGARHAVVVAEPYAERLRALGIRTPTTVVGFGVDTGSFDYAPATPPAAPLFVYGGSYSEWHGADIFVEAFARFAESRPDARLMYIGNGTERPQIARRAEELGIAGSVEFRDPIPGPELAAVLAGATASLASLVPGGYDYAFATKVYSSLAVGCPVLYTGAGPAGPFLTDAARTVAAGVAVPYYADAVRSAMETLAAQPFSADERRALSAWTRAHHSLSAVARRTVAAVAAPGRA